MREENQKESEREIAERFDREMRQTILDAANEIRAEKGLPTLTEEEAAALPETSPEAGDGK
jgi:hypothetical protein